MRTSLTFIITTRCNFRCQHCLREYYTKQYDLPFPLIRLSLLDAKDIGFRHIAITGGEPIFHPEFAEVIQYLVSNGFTWSFVTNASVYKKYYPLIDQFSDQLKYIAISLDGAKRETHDAIREDGSFVKVCQAITHYKAKNVTVSVAFTLNSINKDEVEDAIKLVSELGADAFYLLGLIPMPHNRNLQISWEDKKNAYALLQRLKQTSKIKIDNSTSLHAVTDANKFCDNVNDHEPAINAYGDYIFCCDTIGQGAVLGSLKNETFSELYIKGLKTANWLKEKRKEYIHRKEFFEGFNSCHFCNILLVDKLKLQEN